MASWHAPSFTVLTTRNAVGAEFIYLFRHLGLLKLVAYACLHYKYIYITGGIYLYIVIHGFRWICICGPHAAGAFQTLSERNECSGYIYVHIYLRIIRSPLHSAIYSHLVVCRLVCYIGFLYFCFSLHFFLSKYLRWLLSRVRNRVSPPISKSNYPN